MAIPKLLAGVRQFQGQVFASQRDLFQKLAEGQSPDTLFITCSDSRIDPNLITQTDPGDLFVLRNAGNIIPAYTPHGGGEIATIEFAVTGLNVTHIIVCGHSHCGAMKGLLDPASLEEMPSVAEFLRHSDATRRILQAKYKKGSKAGRLEIAVQENVLTQLENLQTHPAVAAGIAMGTLTLHAWVYEFETGSVYGYDSTAAQFVPLGDVKTSLAKTSARAVDVRSGEAMG
ncbi:carbonic anhydrase [Planctomyces sp. SH-PL14]|uniref:carbonic anhydrase n=1 Tax=Planctomyces sp. SH-PL14 TaxID=1632864 RepID=UPI00078D52C1|nr:carbonic anhydrase [Planctomyces sp. SH-PL14]AMV17179.1 Carbonic anhydrase [Planctomyces sp. SH-PL14]